MKTIILLGLVGVIGCADDTYIDSSDISELGEPTYDMVLSRTKLFPLTELVWHFEEVYNPTNCIRQNIITNISTNWMSIESSTIQLGLSQTNRQLQTIYKGVTNIIQLDFLGEGYVGKRTNAAVTSNLIFNMTNYWQSPTNYWIFTK